MIKHYSEYNLTKYAELFGSCKAYEDLTEAQKDFRAEVQRHRAIEAREQFKKQQAEFRRLHK